MAAINFGNKKEVLFNYIWKLLHYFNVMCVPLFINFYGAKVLIPEKFGDVVYLLTTISLINLFSNFGISGATSKYASEQFNSGEIGVLKTLFPSTSVITLATIPVLLIVFFVMFWSKANSVLLFMCIPFIVFSPLTAILDGLYTGLLKFKSLAILTVIPSIISIVAAFFAIKIWGEYGIIFSYSGYYLVLFWIYYFGYEYRSFKFDKKISIAVFKYSAIIGLGSMSFFLYSRADIFVLKQYNYVKEIGYYEIVMRVFQLILIPIVLGAQVAAPYFIKLKVQQKFTTIKKYIDITTIGVFLAGLLVAIVGYFLFPFLMKLYYPKYYNDNFLIILNILLITIPLKFMGIYLTTGVITPLGYAKIVSFTTLIFGVVNIILDIILVKYYGFVGVFYATLIVHNVNIFLQFVLFRIKLKDLYVKTA